MTSVSSKTNLLLVGQAPGESKIKQAREMGVAIRDAVWLKTVFEKNGLTLRESAMKIEDL
jgi:NAD-dependent DNA ligase